MRGSHLRGSFSNRVENHEGSHLNSVFSDTVESREEVLFAWWFLGQGGES